MPWTSSSGPRPTCTLAWWTSSTTYKYEFALINKPIEHSFVRVPCGSFCCQSLRKALVISNRDMLLFSEFGVLVDSTDSPMMCRCLPL